MAYHPENWFDGDKNLLSEDWGFKQDMPVPLSKSWQKNCAGCHTTGSLSDGTSNATKQNANGEWVNDFYELNVGCEACHGPGSEHIDAPFNEKADYIWKSTDSNVCAQCHVRGKSPDGNHGFPTDIYPGDEVWDHYDLADNVFWPDGNTSKKHHQQWMDWNTSGHAHEPPAFVKQASCANCHTPEGAMEYLAGGELEELPEEVTWNVACVACHGPHGTENEHDIRLPEEKLCAECHTAEGASPPDTPHHPMKEMLAGTGGSGLIGDLRMGGAVTCTDCHMPFTAKSAVPYDIASHTFNIIEPEATIEMGIPNSCTSSCHDGKGSGNLLTDEVAQRVIDKWHGEIEEMIAYTEDNLTATQTAIDEAIDNGLDDETNNTVQEMFEVAEFNFEFVTHEGSEGVHNFEYARALLYDSFLTTMKIRDILEKAEQMDFPPLADAGDTILIELTGVANFDASKSMSLDGTTLTYTWDFDDGSGPGAGITTTHSYEEVGIYEVTLTVTDEDSETDTDMVTVYVIENFESVPADITELEGEVEDLEAALAALGTGNLTVLTALADALGTDVATLQTSLAALDTQVGELVTAQQLADNAIGVLQKDVDDQETLNEQQSKEIEDASEDDGGPTSGMFILVLLLALVALAAVGGSFMMLKEEIDGLKGRAPSSSYDAPESRREPETDDKEDR